MGMRRGRDPGGRSPRRRGVHRQRPGARPASGSFSSASDPASEIYVRNKVKAGSESGLRVDLQRLPATARLDDLLALVERLNAATRTTGFSSSRRCRQRWGRTPPARVRRDRSGQGRRRVQSRSTLAGSCRDGAFLAPCTPSGVIEMLDRCGIRIAGSRAVVIGRSEIVGKPMAMLLLHRDATVTICHSKTPDLPAVAARGRHPRGGDRAAPGS